MIASPSAVMQEREIIREVIGGWNAAHSRSTNKMLAPVGWETDSVPHLGERPQAIINKQILKDADLLVAVFWTRIGTATGSDVSGTVEEIREHVAARKPAMVYFSSAAAQEEADDLQKEALAKFKAECKVWGLYTAYKDVHNFRSLFTRQLAQQMNDGSKFPASDASENPVVPAKPSIPVQHRLSEDAKRLLLASARDEQGGFFWSHTHSGVSIQTNGGYEIVKDTMSRRAEVRWRKACAELEEEGLIEADDDSPDFYAITAFGYEVADKWPERV